MAEAVEPPEPADEPQLPAPETTPGVELEPHAPPATTPVRRESGGALGVRLAPATLTTSQRRRFRLTYGLLALVAGFAVTGFAVVATGVGRPAQIAWSSWKPQGSNSQRLAEIGDHIAARYRLDDGTQMVVAQPNQSAYNLIAVQQTSGGATGYYAVRGPSAAFQLCGGGDRCAIATGQASTDRALLLSREGLELALYTFKYAPHFDSVVVFMPPPLGDTAHFAVLFQRAEFGSLLSHPIDTVLTDRVPTVAQFASSAESQFVGTVVTQRQYRFGIEDLPGTGRVLVLGPANASS
jgi:hypothetical protein